MADRTRISGKFRNTRVICSESATSRRVRTGSRGDDAGLDTADGAPASIGAHEGATAEVELLGSAGNLMLILEDELRGGVVGVGGGGDPLTSEATSREPAGGSGGMTIWALHARQRAARPAI